MARDGKPRPRPFDAARLRTAQTAAGITNEALAEAIGVARESVQRWRRGKGSPEWGNLTELARVLGVSREWLMGE